MLLEQVRDMVLLELLLETINQKDLKLTVQDITEDLVQWVQ